MYKLNNISTPKKLLETVNDLGVRSNPNILINGDFAINQRGASSYAGYGSYTVDRWEKRSSVSDSTINITATGVSIGISVTRTTGIAHLRQRLELDFTNIRGQYLTLSTITTRTGTGVYQIRLRQYSDEWTTAVQTTLLTITSGSLSSVSDLIVANCKRVEVELLSFNYVIGDTVVPTYIKLELGSIATPFVPPLIAEELQKCQRYYWKLNSASGFANIASGFFRDTTKFRALFYTPTVMRTSSTVTINGTLTLLNSSVISTTEYASLSFQGNIRVVQITASSAQTAGSYAAVSLDGGSVEFDAEIY